MALHSVFRTLLAFAIMISSNPFRSLVVGANFSSGSIKAVILEDGLSQRGGITPALFDSIPNKELLDGTKVRFQSLRSQKYLSVEKGVGMEIVANRSTASDWETFKLWRVDENTFQFRAFAGQFLSVSNGAVVALTKDANRPETKFVVVKNDQNPKLANQSVEWALSAGFRQENYASVVLTIKETDGCQRCAGEDGTLVTADSPEKTSRGNDDPSVFLMQISDTITGECQLTNGLGGKVAEVLTTMKYLCSS
ncbi:Cellulase (glycosyl hydrolase family 5) [Musa troglodytarum]|uniref:Cellulase (Glycosyl hydrolase family 5) n=1 Tax=Musa troglodytarum TaxID=320322 RepID=A0A9E7KSG2_9LILI|nr:Cellulase (glycosyl hydrolase family 5) [Musa troglodytarum]